MNLIYTFFIANTKHSELKLTDVGLALQQVTLVEALQRIDLFVGTHNVAIVGLHHQQHLAQSLL